VGFVGVNKNRSDFFIGKIISNLVHGWARQPAIRSGKAAKFDYCVSVLICFRS
jgi:hypothetical protein